ncbi:hypothetical protein H4Q32_012002 [Labeo rohita]|uniref:RNase H type-1 domain-containing protein n=1 Tax=Labeo rohita TaxID=84645 RepID=A0ABQ8MKU1_LABRO|nr:hypothetical protein H4Q32_012002 [Labeo rohita]
MDNMSMVAYINHQGGLHSRRMSHLARHLLLWSQTWLKSLCAIHIPGELNRAADMLSQHLTLPGEWRLHPHVVQLIWSRFGGSSESSHFQLFYSLTKAPLGTDALVHSWPRGLIKYAFPPVSRQPPCTDPVQDQAGRRAGLVGCALLAHLDLVRGTHPLLGSLCDFALITLTSIKRVGDLHAFSINDSCLEFGPADSHIILRPRPGYVPKVPSTPFRDQVVNLQALPLKKADPALVLLCLVYALCINVDRTRSFRRPEQLFVCFGGQQKGNAVSKQRLAHWWLMPSSWLQCCLLLGSGTRRLSGRHM